MTDFAREEIEAAWRHRPEEASAALLARLERELGDLVVDGEQLVSHQPS